MYARRASSVLFSLCHGFRPCFTFVHVVLEGNTTFQDPHRHSASISRIDIRLSVSSRYTLTYTYHIPTYEGNTGPVSGDITFET